MPMPIRANPPSIPTFGPDFIQYSSTCMVFHKFIQRTTFISTEGHVVFRGPEAFNWMYVETDQSHGTTVQWALDPAEQVN